MRYAEVRVGRSDVADCLYAIAFHADMAAYKRCGRTITGATYVRRASGPAPRPDATVDAEPAARVEGVTFTAEELAIIDVAIAECDENARGRAPAKGWALAEIGEVIPEYVALLEAEDWLPDRRVLAAGAELASQL
jgi:hypothetical protein